MVWQIFYTKIVGDICKKAYFCIVKQRQVLRIAIISSLLAFFLGCQDIRHTVTRDSAFGQYEERLDTSLCRNFLRKAINGDTSRWVADKTVRQYYKEHPEPLWYTPMGVSEDADSLLSYLRRELPMNGLDTTAFFIPQIAANLNTVHQLAFDSLQLDINEVLPRLDFLLSKAYVRYTIGQRYGFSRPAQYLNRLDIKPESESHQEYARLFDYEIKAPNYEESMQMLLSEERMNYLYASKPKGYAYQALRQHFSDSINAAERTKTAINIERCRWQIKQPSADEHCIIVNIPSQQLWATCPDSVVPMRICCGSFSHKTPLLCSEISYLQVNPEWIIPQNIIKAEVAVHAGDSAYFARNDYSIVERTTNDTLSVSSVSSSDLKSGRLRVVQKSGPRNSLGRIVFRFPNDFSIYLHDTNNHSAFNRERRTVSHGCVRVQKPFELACFLLPEANEWKLEQLRISMDIPPVSKRGKDYLKEHQDDPHPYRLISYHNVSPKMPLYILYFTLFPNPETGEIESLPDLYGYDKAIQKEIGDLLELRDKR